MKGFDDFDDPTKRATIMMNSLWGDVRELEYMARGHPGVAMAEINGLRELIDRMAAVVVRLTKERAA